MGRGHIAELGSQRVAGAVGLLLAAPMIDGAHRLAGERLRVVGVVAERHPHFDGLGEVGQDQRVAGFGGAVDVAVVGEPLVAERHAGQPVCVGYP